MSYWALIFLVEVLSLSVKKKSFSTKLKLFKIISCFPIKRKERRDERNVCMFYVLIFLQAFHKLLNKNKGIKSVHLYDLLSFCTFSGISVISGWREGTHRWRVPQHSIWWGFCAKVWATVLNINQTWTAHTDVWGYFTFRSFSRRPYAEPRTDILHVSFFYITEQIRASLKGPIVAAWLFWDLNSIVQSFNHWATTASPLDSNANWNFKLIIESNLKVNSNTTISAFSNFIIRHFSSICVTWLRQDPAR